MTISEIFAAHGEPYFRAGETRVIARLLEGGPQVLATGGGAFMNADTRAAIRAKGISVWLRATLEVLNRRIKRRGDRPLLKNADPAETLRRLIEERDPVYAEADLTVESRDVPHETIVDEILEGLRGRIAPEGAAPESARAMTAPLRSGDPITSMSRSASAPMTSRSGAACWRRSASGSPGSGRDARSRSSPTRRWRAIISRRRKRRSPAPASPSPP